MTYTQSQIEDMVKASLSPEDYQTILNALTNRRDILILGSIRTGKTILLTHLAHKIDPRFTIFVREADYKTLDLHSDLPERNIVGVTGALSTSNKPKPDPTTLKDNIDVPWVLADEFFTFNEGDSDRMFLDSVKDKGYPTILATHFPVYYGKSYDEVKEIWNETLLHPIEDFVTIICSYSSADGFRAKIVS